MTPPLLVLGCGMTTAVGLTAAASCAAIRARLDGFAETRFTAPDGSWITGAEVPLEEPWRGAARLAHLVAGPISECLELAGCPATKIPLFLCVAELDRPGRLDMLDAQLFDEVCALLGTTFDGRSRTVPMGRVGAAAVLPEVSRLINQEGVPRIIVGAADSYLLSDTLGEYGSRARLLAGENTNGFLPGEAGAALLLGPDGSGEGLTVRSLGLAMEKATVESTNPLRGEGLMLAFRQALLGAGLEMRQIGYRLSCLNGEQYWFKEAELATSRLLRGRHKFMEFLHPADSIGETGAASLPCAIGMAYLAARKGWAPADPVLAFASNDDGRRAAMILSARQGA